MKDIEIEIQVKIEKSAPLVAFLKERATFKSEKRQVDEYFSPAHRDFLAARPVKEWLRLRDASGDFSITYKNWHYDDAGKSHYADECESKIESLETCRKIFEALNFKSLIVVEKVRKTWDYETYEIALDSVTGLGDFVEVEYKGGEENVDPKQITDGMVAFLKERSVGKIERNYVGYPFLLLFGKEAKWETQ